MLQKNIYSREGVGIYCCESFNPLVGSPTRGAIALVIYGSRSSTSLRLSAALALSVYEDAAVTSEFVHAQLKISCANKARYGEYHILELHPRRKDRSSTGCYTAYVFSPHDHSTLLAGQQIRHPSNQPIFEKHHSQPTKPTPAGVSVVSGGRELDGQRLCKELPYCNRHGRREVGVDPQHDRTY